RRARPRILALARRFDDDERLAICRDHQLECAGIAGSTDELREGHARRRGAPRASVIVVDPRLRAEIERRAFAGIDREARAPACVSVTLVARVVEQAPRAI